MNQTYQLPRHLLKTEIKVCNFCSNSGNKSLLMCVVHFMGEQSVFSHFDIHSAAHISCLYHEYENDNENGCQQHRPVVLF